MNEQVESMPLVSVIMVTYNSADFVKYAIESVLSSTYPKFELIISDDASQDKTWEIVCRYDDSRIRKYRNETNIGEYPNRMKALALATGSFAIFIDGDDMIYPHGLQFMTEQLLAHSDCGMALMYPFVSWAIFPIKISPREFYISNFFGKGFNDLAFANTFFNVSKLKEVSSLPARYKTGDTYIRLEVAAHYPTLIIPDQLTWWRETPGQASQVFSRSTNAVIENFRMHRDIICKHENPLTDTERQQALDNEMFKVKRHILGMVKKFQLQRTLLVLRDIWREGVFSSVVFSRQKTENPFASFSARHPRTIEYNFDRM